MARYNKKPTVFLTAIILLVILGPIAFFALRKPKTTAAWFNDQWHYRQRIDISSHTAAENNVYIATTINTSDTSKFQSDCGDLIFTDYRGQILPYYIVSGCTTASTVVHVKIQLFPSGPQSIYYYYGNQSAQDGFSNSDFSTEAQNYTIGSIASQEVGEAPILWLKFDEGTGTTSYNSAGTNGNGTLINGPIWKDELNCIIGKCLYFDGTNDYIDYGNLNEINFGTGSFTVSTWFKSSGTSDIAINKKVVNQAGFDLLLGADNVSRRVRFSIGDGTRNIDSTNWDSPNDNNWHYVVGVANRADNTFKTYGDGVLIGSVSISTLTSVSNTNSFNIGRRTTGDAYFVGYLDDVKIYPYARTATQIAQDYNMGLSGQSISTNNTTSFDSTSIEKSLTNGLVGYWKMNENTGTTTSDATGNNLNGTLSSGATWNGGKFGSGINFNGSTTGQITVNNNTFLIPTTLSISAWVKTNSPSSPQIIATKRYSGADPWNSYILDIYNSKPRFSLSTTSPGSSIGLSASNDITTGWTHVTGTYDGTTMKIYVNGTLENSTSFAGPIGYSTTGFYIGNYGSGWSYSGLIDEVRVYNRPLSDGEVKDLYNYVPGPINYWNFDETIGSTALDKGTAVKPLPFVNPPGSPIYTTGKIGTSLYFDGNDGIGQNDSGYTASLTKNMTVNAWIKTDSTSSGGIVCRYGNSSSWTYCIYMSSDGKINYLRSNNSTTTFSTTLTSNKTINDNNWHYISATFDGSYMKVFIDGILDNTVAETRDSNFSLWSFCIGNQHYLCDGSGYNGRFKGTIDEVKIYNYARTQSQILQDMQGTSNTSTTMNKISQPLIWYKFNEGFGTNSNNSGSSGSESNGTIYLATYTLGKVGKSLNFNGTTDYVSLPLSQLPSGNQSRTITGWFNPDQNYSLMGQSFLNYGNDNTGQRLSVATTNDEISVAINGCRIGKNGLSLSGWHHISVILPAGSTVCSDFLIYLDGVQQSLSILAGTRSTAINTINSYAYIGKDQPSNLFYNGLIDEVKIYNYALTEDEVKQDYNSQSTTRVGATTQTINDTTTSLEYCPPGDTSTCYSPVVEYDFEEGQGDNVNDKSGNNANTTNVNNPSWATGKIGKGMQFDGSSNFTKNTSTPLTSLTNWSLEAWIKPANLSQIGLAVYNGKDSGGYGFGVGNGSGGAGNKLQGLLGGIVWLNSNYTFPIANEWYHIVMTRDTSTTRMYVNGVQTSGYVRNTPATVQSAITVGALLDGSNNPFRYFSGSVDQVRFYNYTRTPAQIAWSYNKGKPLAYYKLDECQGNTIHDSSGNNIHGTLTVGASGTQTSIGTCNTTSTAWGNGATGKINSSLNFDGIDDYVQTSTPVSTSTTNITMSAWVKWSGTNTGSPQIIYFNGSTSSNGYGFYLNTSDKLVILTGGRGSYITSYTPPIDTWTHLLISRGTGNFSLYIDGINYPITLTGRSSVLTPTASTFFGGISGQSFSGQVDDVRFYNYAPTDTQIKELYNGSALNFAPAQ